MLVNEPDSMYSKNISDIKQSIFDIGKIFKGETPYDEEFTSLRKDICFQQIKVEKQILF